MPSMNGRDSLPVGDTTGQPDALPRAQPNQQQDAAAAEMPPGLGALNRQLKLVVEHLAAAHRHLGRVAAERDAFRQQLADLQGIPVEEVPIPAIGAPSQSESQESDPQGDAPPAASPESDVAFQPGDGARTHRGASHRGDTTG